MDAEGWRFLFCLMRVYTRFYQAATRKNWCQAEHSTSHRTVSLCLPTISRKSILFSKSRAIRKQRRSMMRLGLWFSNYRWPQDQESLGDTFATIAQRAERAGLSSLWVPDHFLMPPRFGDPDDNMLESWSALAFLAGRTNRIKLGTMVTGVTYRHPLARASLPWPGCCMVQRRA